MEKITIQMASTLELEKVLKMITQGLVNESGASCALVWVAKPCDLYSDCDMSAYCVDRDRCLHLKGYSGASANPDPHFHRIPFEYGNIGRIARSKVPILCNDLPADDDFSDKSWIRENGFQSFSGHPLVFGEDLTGVLALFSRQIMNQSEFGHMGAFASQAAISIKNAQLFTEVEQLKDKLQAECVYLQQEIKLNYNFEEIVGQCEIFKNVLYKAEQVAPTSATVLILGETGTGKELIARAIHSMSARNKRPLVTVNCSALSPTLIENELFGHKKGAFTGALSDKIGRFELADRGTIFLDEIGALPLESQAKLLRVIQEGEFERVGSTQTRTVDVRIIAATNSDLEKAIEGKDFRQDLYYRLNVFPITIPPLRERIEDIPLLANYFTKKYSTKFGKAIDTIPQQVIHHLQAYSWPGNVRELENIIERAVILSSTNSLQIKGSIDTDQKDDWRPPDFKNLFEVERAHIVQVLDTCNWVIEGNRGAALRLGLKPGTLRSKMKKHGIQRPLQSA
jgi:formate hydrogenlyase transcriptional activator